MPSIKKNEEITSRMKTTKNARIQWSDGRTAGGNKALAVIIWKEVEEYNRMKRTLKGTQSEYSKKPVEDRNDKIEQH